MALRGLSTLNTLRIFTTEMALDLDTTGQRAYNEVGVETNKTDLSQPLNNKGAMKTKATIDERFKR